MTDIDYPLSTNPLRIGAPLPTDLIELRRPANGHIRAEILRCEVELMHAIAKHRKAWSLMRKWSAHREEAANTPGQLAALESDPVWKKRVGDVTWWRDEMNARAAALLALQAML